VAASVLK